MNDSQLLERLASTDAYAPQMPLPSSARTRDAAIAEIVRRTDMQTQKRTESQAPPRRARDGWLVAAAAFVVVLLLGVAMAFWASQGDQDVVEPTTTTSGVPTTITTIPPPPEPVPPMVDAWQRTGGALMGPVVGTFDMTVTGSQLIVVGFDPGEDDHRQNGVIFVSDDGVTWARLAEDDPALTLGAVLMYGIAEAGPGLVAVGMGCEDDTAPCLAHPTVWTSVDGAEWTRSGPDPEIFGEGGAMLDVIATDHGVVAVGSTMQVGSDETSLSRSAVWLSPDGLDWSRVWDGDPFDTKESRFIPGIMAVTADPAGLIVGVGTAENDLGESVAAVWVSADGQSWERVERNSSVFGSDAEADVTVVDVTWGEHGFVAVGTEGGTEAAIWQSTDGRSWIRIDTTDQTFDTIGSLGSVAALDSGYTAVGPHPFIDDLGGWVTLWTSPDGLEWDRVHAIGEGYASGVVVADGGIAVAGGISGSDNFHAAVWVGPLFDPEAPPPDPEPPLPEGPAPEDPVTGIAALEEGLSCDEIATEAFSYREAVSYWVRYELTEDFDLDTDGTPCAAAYSAAEIEEVFGEPDALSVLLLERHPTGTFAATGPAVDAGLVCPDGTIDYTTDPDTDTPGVLWRWEDVFTCDDGSGTFLLGVDEYIDSDGAMFGVWNIVSGTGDYETLNGGGFTDSIFADFDASTGRLWLGANED